MEVQFYYIRLQGTEKKDRIKESSNYRGSNYGDYTVAYMTSYQHLKSCFKTWFFARYTCRYNLDMPCEIAVNTEEYKTFAYRSTHAILTYYARIHLACVISVVTHNSLVHKVNNKK